MPGGAEAHFAEAHVMDERIGAPYWLAVTGVDWVTPEQVEEAVRQPDHREAGKKGRMIATRGFTEHLVLRVIYRETGEAFEIVTFYPGRRSRYENPVRQG